MERLALRRPHVHVDVMVARKLLEADRIYHHHEHRAATMGESTSEQKVGAPAAAKSSVGIHAGLSLWLQPSASHSPTTMSTLHALMGDLRRSVEEQGADTAPAFEPHATLLSGLTCISPEKVCTGVDCVLSAFRAELRQHPKKQEPFHIPVQAPATRGTFFQCVLLPLIPTNSLLALNEAMRKEFNQEHQPTYFPHVSLLYADIGADGAKQQIDRLEHDGWFSPAPASESGASRIGQARANTFESINLVTLSLWDTNGPVQDWSKLREWTLPR